MVVAPFVHAERCRGAGVQGCRGAGVQGCRGAKLTESRKLQVTRAMPYKFAYLYVAVLLIVTIIGFWPSYFSIIDDAPFAFHVHAFTATAWVVLVGFQSWSIHHQARNLHCKVGKLSLLLFPLLIASLVMIANVSASKFLQADNLFYHRVGPIFGYVIATAIMAYLVLFVQALRHRRNVYIHAGYMLAAPFMLWESNFGRVLQQLIPSIQVVDSIVYPDIMAAAFAVFLFLRDRRHGYPFLVVAIFLIAQLVGIYLVAEAQWFRDMFTTYAQLPQPITVGTGFVLGLLAVWLGWTHPSGPARIALARK
jgi:hypothetical protein